MLLYTKRYTCWDKLRKFCWRQGPAVDIQNSEHKTHKPKHAWLRKCKGVLPVKCKAKLHQQRAAAAVQQSESDSDESVSEPPSKSARVDDDTGASSCSEHLVCDAPVFIITYIIHRINLDSWWYDRIARRCHGGSLWVGEPLDTQCWISQIDFIRRIVRTMECSIRRWSATQYCPKKPEGNGTLIHLSTFIQSC